MFREPRATDATGAGSFFAGSFGGYTYAWFEGGDAGDGTTLALAASKNLSDSLQPTFVALWGHFGTADDEVARPLPGFGEVDVGLRQNWYRGGVNFGFDYSHSWIEGADAGRAAALRAGGASESEADATALHVGLTWMFESRHP
ncbi:hypothetical protein [Candidatus Palauibacter sp.]|uniref:hypothetical protein n=1 Tax=Candidatus Palauibacter sp. TaxID=3101350 RepID=UPI003D0F8768